MAGFLSAAITAIGSSSIGGALVRLVIAYGVSRLINRSTGEQNQQFIDKGVRLQLQPNTTNPIPLLYGSAYYGGNITDAQLTNSNQTLWVCLTLSEHTTTPRLSDGAAVNTFVEEVYYNNQLITFKSDGITVDFVTNSDGTVDTSARDLVKVYLYKNGSGQPTLPSDFLPGTLPPAAHTLFPGWDSTWTMSNLTFALVRIDYNRDKGITGIPDMRFKVSNTLFKPGDALYDYFTNSVSGAGLTANEIDTANLVALNAYADDSINFFNEDTQDVEVLGNRYQINGLIDPQRTVLENMQEIANSTGVFINYDITTGKWGTIIDRDQAVTLAFNDSNIVGGIDVTATSLDNMYNAVEAEFVSRFIQDQTDSIRIELPTEFRNANEPDNVLNIKFSMLNEPVQARTLAYLALYQNRLDRVVTFTTDYSKINVEAGDIITLTNSIYGFNQQPLRVIRVKEVEADDGNLLIEIVAQEYDSTLYTAGGQPRRPRTPSAPINMPSPGVIATPAAPLITVANNNAQPSILLSGVIPDGVVDRFEFWYSTDDWASYTLVHEEKNANGAPFNSDTTILVRISTLPEGIYKFKVRAGNAQAYSQYSDSSVTLDWKPNQITDQVDNDTLYNPGFDLGDLLPVLGMGALAYFAYKALYPELLKALSTTELGKLLGIEDPDEIAAAEAELEKQANAFKIVKVGATEVKALEDQTLTLVAGTGISIEAQPLDNTITINATGQSNNNYHTILADDKTLIAETTQGQFKLTAGNGVKITAAGENNEITITNTCCVGDVDEEGDPIVDYGIPQITELDNCKQVVVWPDKIKTTTVPAQPAVPQTWLEITGAGTWYDPCYKQNVETIKIADPANVLNMKIGDKKTLTGVQTPSATGQIDWTVSYLQNRTIQIKKVTATDYVAIKNWNSSTGADLPLTGDNCDISEPNSRPLFPSVDYPNGYELATVTNLTPVLAAGSVLRFVFVAAKAAVPESTTSKVYPGKREIVKQARTCVRKLTVTKRLVRNDVNAIITLDTWQLASNEVVPVGSTVYGTFTSGFKEEAIEPGTKVIENLDGTPASNTFRLNKQYDNTTGDPNIAMYYYKPVTKLVDATDVADNDYNEVT
jgi:hypothetical protein